MLSATAALKRILLFVCVAAISLLAGCGGGGGGSNLAALPTPDSSVKLQDSPLMSGKGQITQFAASGDTLFWADALMGGRGIWKYTRGDAAPKLLVTKLGAPSSMVVRGEYCYWIGGGVQRSTRDGSDTTLIYYSDNRNIGSCSNIADDRAFYFGQQDSKTGSYIIKSIPFDGTGPNYLVTTTHKISALACDDNFIYWQESVEQTNPPQTRLRRIPKSGGAAETVCESIISAIGDSTSMVVYSNSVFIGTYGKLLKVPAAGGAAEVVVQGDGIYPFYLVARQGMLYWLNPDDSGFQTSSLVSAPVAGGAVNKIVGNLVKPSGLRGSEDGLYWMEDTSLLSAAGQTIKRVLWGGAVVETLTEEFYPSSFDVADGYLYCTEVDAYAGFSQVSRIPITAGAKRQVIFGGVDSVASAVSLYATANYLLIGDGGSVKKVPISGGITTTLVTDRLFTKIEEIKERDGVVCFTASGTRNGLYSIPLAGGPMVALAEGGLYDKIVSIQDGYAYYNYTTWGSYGSYKRELRRVALTGNAPPETVYSFPAGTAALAYDGIGTIFMERDGYNDQGAVVVYEVATGKSTTVYSGSGGFMGFDDASVYILDIDEVLYQIPRSGGSKKKVFALPYRVSMSRLMRWERGFYFNLTYLDPQTGYSFQVDALEPPN